MAWWRYRSTRCFTRSLTRNCSRAFCFPSYLIMVARSKVCRSTVIHRSLSTNHTDSNGTETWFEKIARIRDHFPRFSCHPSFFNRWIFSFTRTISESHYNHETIVTCKQLRINTKMHDNFHKDQLNFNQISWIDSIEVSLNTSQYSHPNM